MLKSRVGVKDAKVSLAGFRYSDRTTEPSLDAVMKSPFWSLPQYESLHQRLSKPVPHLQLRSGGDLVTIDTQKERAAISQLAITDTGDEHQVCLPIEMENCTFNPHLS